MTQIMIVDDSPTDTHLLKKILEKNGFSTVTAKDADEGLAVARREKPDLILMDLIMPVMGGVEATRLIMQQSPCAIVVVTASVQSNASKVFEAMGAGALDAVNTPVLGQSGSTTGNQGSDALLAKLNTIRMLIRSQSRVAAASPQTPKACIHDHPEEQMIAIGASTGGPAALAEVLKDLPLTLPASIVVIQHVDEQFAASFTSWLNDQIALPVRMATPGDRPQRGTVLVAGSKDHLVLDRGQRLTYTPEPAEYPYRPSVDAYFNSLVAHWQGVVTGVLLTGMGRDGAQGLFALRQQGWHTLAQDKATSAVYGMPKAAAELDAAVEILPLGAIGKAIAARHEVTKKRYKTE